MFGAHLPELLIILVGALIVFGPKRLPEIGGALGKGIRDFKHGINDLHQDASAHHLSDPLVQDPQSAHPLEGEAR